MPENTVEQLLIEIFRREKNLLEILSGLQEIYSSSDEKVIINWEKLDGSTQEFEVASIGKLSNDIRRLQQDTQSLSGVGVRSATLRLPDGTIKPIITSSLPIAPKEIASIPKPTFFYSRNNKKALNLTDPYTFVKIDLNAIIPTESTNTKILLYELTLDTSEKVDYFNNSLKATDMSHDNFLQAMSDQEIATISYEESYPLNSRLPKYSGNFSILEVNKKTLTLPDATTESVLTLYRFNTLLYKDLITDSDVSLRLHDTLVVNNGSRNTIYEVTFLDSGTNEVALLRREGFNSIIVGTDVLSIESKYQTNLEVEIPITKNKSLMIFAKGINPLLNIESVGWGTGFGLAPNELISFENIVAGETFLNFYSNNAKNLEDGLNLLKEEFTKPASLGISPNLPILDTVNFKVVVINDHKKEASVMETIKQKYSEKKAIDSKIANLDTAILATKEKSITDSTLTSTQKTKISEQLDSHYTDRASLVKELGTKVDEINTQVTSDVLFEPKYKIIGFLGIPELKYVNEQEKLNPIEIIGFEVQYRYLTTTNTTTNLQTFDGIDKGDGTKAKATFSKWIPLVTPLKEKDPISRKWKAEDLNSSEDVNINQVDVTISRGENVEIRARSISEIGYPFSPVKSEWSDPLQIPFPEALLDSTSTISENAKNDKVLAQFQRELQILGLDQHTKDSLQIADKLYVHNGDNIATDELTPENKPKTVNAVLKEIKNETAAIQAQLLGINGEPKIFITDSLGAKIKEISNNETVNLFAGYYKQLVANSAVPKGDIVTSLYFIEVENISDADLELLSYVPGNYTEKVPNTDQFLSDLSTANPVYENYDGFVINREEFRNYRRQWNSPLSLRGIVENNSLYTHHFDTQYPFVQLPSFQSFQTKGSYVFTRERDLTLNNKLYKIDDLNPANQVLIPIFSGSTPQTFIWNGTQTLVTPNGGGFESDFAIHVDHPDLLLGTDFMTEYSTLYYNTGIFPIGAFQTLPKQSIHVGNSRVYYPPFIHSAYFDKNVVETDGLVQLRAWAYNRIDETISNATIGTTIPFTPGNFPRKIGFSLNDKYLIGKKTCGSYLYLAPATHQIIHSGSIVYNNGLIIKKDASIKVRIPIIFEARLTDYYGAGSSGTGRVGGDPTKTNLTYGKKIGIDLAFKNRQLFSFDLKIEMQYTPNTAASVNNLNRVDIGQ